MWFADGLKHTANISTVSIAEDSFWKETKTFTALYENMKCRLGKWTPRQIKSNEKDEKFVVTYKLYTLPEYSAGKNGDQVIIGDDTFIIYGHSAAVGGETNHYIYNITADE